MHKVFIALHKFCSKNWFSNPDESAEVNETLNTGICFLSLGLWREALARLNQVICLTPHSPAAHCYRGIAHEALGHYGQAMKDYTTAVLLDPRCTRDGGGKKGATPRVLCK